MKPAVLIIVFMLLVALVGGGIVLATSSSGAKKKPPSTDDKTAPGKGLSDNKAPMGSEYPRVYFEFDNAGWGTSKVCPVGYEKGHRFRYSGQVQDYDEKAGNYTVQWDKIETVDDPVNCPPKLLYSTSESEGDYWTPDSTSGTSTENWKTFFFGDAETKTPPFYSIANQLKQWGGGMTQSRSKVKIVPPSMMKLTKTTKGDIMM